MSLNNTKLLISILAITGCSVIATKVSGYEISRDENPDLENADEHSGKWQGQWKEQPRWQIKRKVYNLPYMNVISGNSKEWTNFEHSHPLKRSDNTFLGPNPNLTDDSGILNMTNPLSKYHCPINLLYGNNLTVKNFFLLVPRCNASSNDTIQQMQSAEGGEFNEPKVASTLQPQQPASNEIGSVFNEGTETTQLPTSSESSAISITAENGAPNNTLPPGITLEAVDLTLTKSTEATEEASNLPKLGPSNQTATKIEDVFVKPLERMTSTDLTGSEGVTNPSQASDSVGTSVGGSISTEAPSVGLPSAEGTTPSVYFEAVSILQAAANATLETATVGPPSSTACETLSEAQTTVRTTLDQTNEILRTLDKYCETFNISDNGSYTINPASIGTQQAHFHDLLEDKSKIKEQIIGIKKSKRTLLNKNPRKYFKKVI